MFGMVWKVLINDCIFLYLYLYVIMLYLFLCFIELYLSLHFVGSYLYLFLFALCGVLACCLKTCICSCICMTLTLGFVEVYLHSFGLNNAVIKLHFSVFIFLHVLYSFAFLSLIIKLIRHQDVCLLIVCVFLFIFQLIQHLYYRIVLLQLCSLLKNGRTHQSLTYILYYFVPYEKLTNNVELATL